MDHPKIIIGTEIYMSELFSDLWLRAANNNIPDDVEVIVFDNNPDDREESKFVEKVCNSLMGFKYIRLLPHCHQNHSVELLRLCAINAKVDYYFHIDIDCPPLMGMFEKMVDHINDGAIAVTEKAGAHCFICDMVKTVDMTCQRIPHRPGEQRSRFSDLISGSNYGVPFFDHCRWMFHELELREQRVDIVDYNFVHATVASFKDKSSMRHCGWENNKELQDHIENVHRAFWNVPEIKELMCQKQF